MNPHVVPTPRRGRRLGTSLAAALVGAVLALAASCGGDDPYDTSCSADADCVAVDIGRSCSGCGDCRKTVINRADVDRYNEDRREDDDDCNEGDIAIDTCTGIPCVEASPFCSNGRCALR